MLSWGAARPLAALQRAPATPFGERLRRSEAAEREREREETMSFLFFSPRLARASRSPNGVAGGGLQPVGLEGGTPVPPTQSSLRRRWRSQRGPELVHRRPRSLKCTR